jgi:hypothetical protein
MRRFAQKDGESTDKKSTEREFIDDKSPLLYAKILAFFKTISLLFNNCIRYSTFINIID